MRRDEENLLGPWLWAFEKLFGEAPKVLPWTHPQCENGSLHQLQLPAVFDPPELAGRTGHFKHMPTMIPIVRAMGFDWPDGQFIHIVPTPESFNAMLRATNAGSYGYELAYMQSDSETLPTGPWLAMYLGGTIPIHVASEAFYKKKVAKALKSGAVDLLQFHLLSTGHDLSVHALNYHLIPRSSITAIRDHIYGSIPERASEWADGGAAPLTLTYFLDNDLNRFCYAVWCRSASIEQFGEIFSAPANLGQLMTVLDTRLEETRAGKGDVASGDTNDMPALAQTEFTIR
ncbi:MAG: hypothetical protein CMH54_10635 [Myxococcales bacterium]|nr:hypothetical protein [Myxococcales bacterium]|tara:strand:+ start:193 stop:1056 length:864 start_codon:yes stop_codon:yes gene_type:complete